MKKNLLSLIGVALLITSTASLKAQDAAYARWDLNSATTTTPATFGNVTAGQQTLDPSMTINGYRANTSTTGDYANQLDTGQRALPTGGWPATQTAEVATQWAQYTIAPAANQNLTVTKIKIDFGDAGSTSTMKANLYYSLDGFATAGTKLNTDPLTLPKFSTTELWDMQEFTGLNISVPQGSTLTFRVYAWWPGAASTSKYFFEKDVIISGTTTPATTNPLSFLSFGGKINSLGNQVKLDWSTADEVNTSSFTIERSTAGAFSVVGTVPAKNVSGKQSYTFVDNNPAAGVSYYRLTQTDKDGKSKTFNQIVKIENNGVSFSVSPNPTNQPSVKVKHPEAAAKAVVKITDLRGRVVATASPVAGSNETNVDVSNLAAGLYIVSFENGGQKLSYKFVKE